MTISRRKLLVQTAALGAVAASAPLAAARTAPPGSVERWGLYEIALSGPSDGNPFDDVTIAAIFESGTKKIRVPGFYDGEGVYRIRFSPPELGEWRWRTESTAPALAGKTGTVTAVAPGRGNHGPAGVTPDGYHFAYADGTPFRQIGTTSYSWALQSDAKCAETIETLRTSPFNKMRMLVFPNVPSVALDPFVRTGPGIKDWDPTRPDPAYFRRYEDRIRRLGALGIEADIILFHPYEDPRGAPRWFSDMKRADDERYLRYVIARFGAFRNVWWSLANEYDVVRTKKPADWKYLGEFVRDNDPHDRLRSIHQYKIYYDHREPWITHASVQNGAGVLDNVRADLHRHFALKPVIFDEAEYEGKPNSGILWGDLSGQDMLERFWWGLIGGCYVGHSEIYSDGGPDISYLGQGGKLQGTSPPRLAFLRKIMEEGPRPGFEPIDAWWDSVLGGKPFETYMTYFGKQAPDQWQVVLPGKASDPLHRYRAEIIDTWNMTITPVDGVFAMAHRDTNYQHDPARPAIALPGKPYLAVRLTKV